MSKTIIDPLPSVQVPISLNPDSLSGKLVGLCQMSGTPAFDSVDLTINAWVSPDYTPIENTWGVTVNGSVVTGHHVLEGTQPQEYVLVYDSVSPWPANPSIGVSVDYTGGDDRSKST